MNVPFGLSIVLVSLFKCLLFLINEKFSKICSVFPDFEIRCGGHLVSLLFEMHVNYSKITLSAAFRINNFAVWSHIAGTVRTQRMSPFLIIDPLFSNEFSKWSFRYLIAWEKTVIAFNSRPRMSEIFIFIVNFYKTKLHPKAFNTTSSSMHA